MQTASAAHKRTTETWTTLSLIQWGTEYLMARGFDEGRLTTEMLLCHVLRLSRLHLYTQFDRPLSLQELSEFKLLFQRRLMHEPLQYILGQTNFMGLELFVDRRVLIPRPETEELVERVVEVLEAHPGKSVEVLDVGTGSGNIAAAIATLVPKARITAIDSSKDALAVARSNMQRHGITTVELVHADVLSDFLPERSFELIVSNPPYISAADFELLPPEIRDFEPRIATTDGGDGYMFIRRICELARWRLRPKGWLFFEIAYGQAEKAKEIATAEHLSEIEVFPDCGGILRMLKARHNGSPLS
jgi:release factor glutamine methyltransferase